MKQKITIRRAANKRFEAVKVDAEVFGVWAVHLALKGGGWVVTHVPTGCMARSYDMKRWAVACAEDLAKHLPRWGHTQRGNSKAAYDRLSRYTKRYAGKVNEVLSRHP